LQLNANSPFKAPSRAFAKLDLFYLADLPNGMSSGNLGFALRFKLIDRKSVRNKALENLHCLMLPGR